MLRKRSIFFFGPAICNRLKNKAIENHLTLIRQPFRSNTLKIVLRVSFKRWAIYSPNRALIPLNSFSQHLAKCLHNNKHTSDYTCYTTRCPY